MKKPKSQKTGKQTGAKPESTDNFLIVGIGASAGGVQALKTFFGNVPADSGAAYVVILHLSPDYDSQLTEILQAVSKIPVEKIGGKVRVEPDHVYVISPNESLSMRDGEIIVSPIQTVEERRAPVDIFFRTLAESHEARAVAVVLSGTGANGSMGLKRVKEKGGAAFVQNPREADFSEMPRNSIATELVDEILNVAEIPAKIIAYQKNIGKFIVPVETTDVHEAQQRTLNEIFTQLKVRTGHDFSNYKRPTVLRRIERRINVRELPTLSAYAAYLKKNPDETQSLLKDLLISVTNFFRDKEAFQYLESEVIPKILREKKAGNQVRVWVAGCATGEEAYSLAMLFTEQTADVLDAPRVQIFATDIDETAIITAREGFYTLNDAADVSPERLRRFFYEEAGGYRVRRELREMILFASHNLLKDPPFSRLDLATCRNLMIYFNQAAQKRVLETIHFALNPGGYLFLGTSEAIDGASDLFGSLSLEKRVFQARQTAPRIAYPVPDLLPSLRYGQTPHSPADSPPPREPRPTERISYGDLHGQLLEQYAPPSIIVNEQYEVVHVSPNAGRYLQIAGEVSRNLFQLIRPELRLELSTAVYQAVQRQTNVVAENLKFTPDDRPESVRVSVRPVLRKSDHTARGFILIIFEQTENLPGETEEAVFDSSEPIARQLEKELMRSQNEFRRSVEQSEIQAEELKASNEELQAINEELRSATEELETGKEELQSVNEELITVNQELKIKIEELSQSNNDLQNLINSTQMGTIFLDRRLRVKLFTPAARAIFNLIPADTERLLSDITHRLEYQELVQDVETVLNTLQAFEREVSTVGGDVYWMRITPYRTPEDNIAGAIITFDNITKRSRQEKELRELHERLEQQARIFITTLSSIDDFAYIFDQEGRFVYSNQPLLDLLGITLEEIVGKNFFDLNYPEELAARLQSQIQDVFKTGEIVRDETPFASSTGESGIYEYILTPVRAADDAVELVAGSTRDITERKRREANLAFLADFSRVLLPLSNETEIIKVFGEKISRLTNASVCALFQINDKKDEALITSEWHRAESSGLSGLFSIPEMVSGEFQRLMDAGETVVVRDVAADSLAKDKKQFAALGIGSFVNLPLVRHDQWTLVLGVYHDRRYDWRDDEITLLGEAADRIWTKIITTRADEEVRESEELTRIAVEVAEMGTWDWNLKTNSIRWNERHFILFGMKPRANPVAPEEFFDHVHEDDREWVGSRLMKAVETQTVFEAQFRTRMEGTGEIRWMEGYGKAVEVADGKTLRMSGVVSDVTERKNSRDLLHESEERLRLILRSVEDYAIITTDPDGIVNGWNTGAAKIFGYTESEIIGRGSEILFTPEDRAKGVPASEIRTAIERGSSEDERFHLRKDGSRFYVSGVMQPLKDDKIDGFVKIVRDMTEKIAAEQIRRDREMLQKLVGAQEDERKRIARDLHDELGQIVTGLRLKLEAVRQLCENNAELRGKVDETQVIVRHLDAGIDFLAWELRPAALDDLGLHAALAKYVSEWSHYSGTTAELLGSGAKKSRLAPEVETNLYRIAQEALNNVHKHARAKTVEVIFDRRGDSIVLIIEDDGRGFDTEDKMNREKGIGLIGMRERAALVGGTLEIESAPGKGATVHVRVPVSFAGKENR